MNTRSRSIRLMTWNIHGAVGTDGRFNIERITDIIKGHAPDVIAIQEVDSRRLVAGIRSPFDLLREAVGDHGIHAKSITTADGDYGQMLVSRWPLRASAVHDISHANREPRRAIETEVSTDTGTIRVIAAHLGLKLGERRFQAQRLLEIVKKNPTPTVMLGDFNDWFWPGSLRDALRHEFPARTGHSTYPSRFPIFRLDRVFCWPRHTLVRSFVDREARHASDHLPLIADVALPAATVTQQAVPFEQPGSKA
jgi:endonuclease/exonuclease/phosphatase family metal-dependent hydrolase